MASSKRSPSVNSYTLEEGAKEASSEMLETVPHPPRSAKAKEGAWSSAKENPKVIMYSVTACISSMLWGFDIGVNSITVALPGFKMVFGYEYGDQLLISATWNALWTAMTSLGMLIGSIASGWISDRGGRRAGFAIGSAISILGVGLEYAANEPGLLLAGKIINGLSLGFFLSLGAIYASEIAPTALRPSLTAAVNLFINAGQLTAIGIGNTRFSILSPASYKVIFAAQWAFPCFIGLFSFFMPESPWYLCRKGHIEQAKKSLQRLHSKSTNTDLILEDIQTSIAAEASLANIQKDTSYRDCFRAGCFTTTAAMYYIGYVMNFAQLFYSPTVGAVSWTISAEVSSVKARAKTQSLAIVTNALVSWAMNFIAPYLINTDQANLGGKAAFVWMALSFLSLLWAWLEVPELRNRTFGELDDMFAQKTPTRHFGKAIIDPSPSFPEA
ncbi:maltose permease [Penicillium brevicompactum]